MSLLDRRLPLLASPSSRLRVLLSAAIRCLFVGITLVPRPLRAEPLEWSRWPMPAPRRSNVAGYDQVGNRLLIYGGFGTGQDGFNGETWALTLGAAPGWSLVHEFGFGTAQCLFAQDATANREFVLGGQNNGITGQGISDLALATGAWTAHSPTGTAPTLVTYDSPATVYDSSRNHLVLLGGQSMGSDSYSFDPATSVWSTSAGTGTVPTVVGKFAAYDPVRDRFIAFGSGGMYQVTAGTFVWTLLTAEIHGAAMIYDVARDRVETVTSAGAVWAMSMDTPPQWTQLSSSTPPIAPWEFDTPVVHDTRADRLVVHSGSQATNATWAYSLPTNTWSLVEAGSPLDARTGHSSVIVPPWNALVSFGGRSGDATVSRFALDGTGFQSVPTAGAPPAGRYAHAAIYDPVRARMLVFGGTNGPGYFSTTGAYFNDVYALSIGPTPTWTKLLPTGTPPDPRAYCEAVYDPIRDRMLVFGGVNASVSSFRDLWALSLAGTPTWTRLFDNGAPPQLPELNPYGQAMVYDSRRDRVVVVASDLSTLRAWSCPLSGAPAWTAFAGNSFERMFFDAAYDSLNDRVLAFGGGTSSFTVTTGALATLAFPSGTWGALSPANPPRARFDHTFVRDAAHGRFVVMGGSETNGGDPYHAWAAAVWFLNDAAANVGVPPGRIPDVLALASCRLVSADRVSVSADVPTSGPITLEVFDVLGRRWGRSQEIAAAGGRHEFTVPLKAAASPGLYFVRMFQGARSAGAKLVAVF